MGFLVGAVEIFALGLHLHGLFGVVYLHFGIVELQEAGADMAGEHAPCAPGAFLQGCGAHAQFAGEQGLQGLGFC